MPTSTKVRGNLKDGLTLCQSHSYRLSREEAVFPDLEEPELVSPQGVVNKVQSGAQCFMIFTRMEVEEKEGTSVIPAM